jgi:hypothetical protein
MRKGVLWWLAIFIGVVECYALPSGFIQEDMIVGLSEPIGLTFDDMGRLFVWEKAGRL